VSGYNKSGYLDPDACFFIASNRVEYGLELRAANLTIKVIAESLQVDICRMKIGLDYLKRFRGDVAVRHENVFEPSFSCKAGSIVGKFEVYGRFSVGIGNAGTTIMTGCLDDSSWSDFFPQYYSSPVMRKLRNIGILAVLAVEVASGSRDRIRSAARQKMKERFFFYGIDVAGDHFVIDEAIEDSLLVFAHAADSAFLRRYKTAMAAQPALNLLSFPRLLEHCQFHGQPPRRCAPRMCG